MSTPIPARPARVATAVFVILSGGGAAGAVLAAVTRAITGGASPLPATPPWRWSLRDIARWFSTDATSSTALDVAVRVLAAVAWVALALIVVNLLREVAHQSRHGVVRRRPGPVTTPDAAPTTRSKVPRQHTLAATLVAILLGGTTLAAGTATALPARTPAGAVIDQSATDRQLDAAAAPADVAPGVSWRIYTITSPHESLASIARQHGDNPELARSIWDANAGRDMGNGERFTDPAVVKPGWTLRIPAMASTVAPSPADPAAPAPVEPTTPSAAPVETVPATSTDAPTPAPPDAAAAVGHIVTTETGDTLWGLIDDVVDTPTAADIDAVAEKADGATTPLGPWVFHADNPDLIHTGMPFDLQPAIDLHAPPTADAPPSPAAPADAGPTTPPTAAADAPPPQPAAPPTVADTELTDQAAPPDPAAASPDAATTTPTAQSLDPTGGDVDTTAAPTVVAVASTPPATVATSPAVSAVPAPTAPVPAATTAQPDDMAPPIDTPATDDDAGDTDTARLPVVPLAVAGMTIAGLLAGLDRRRRRRQAHDPHGRAAAVPGGELAADERVIRSAARLDRAARANAALRHLSTELAARAGVLRSRYILVTDTAVTVVLEAAAAAPAGWEPVEDPVGWRCVLDDTDLAHVADTDPHPWPAVVPLGVTVHDDATVLVDLEAHGITSLTGPGGADVLAAMICALGASPSLDALTVIDDGHVALYGLDRYLANRIQLDGIEAVLDRLEAWSEPFRFETRHLLTQRHDDPGELEPCVAAVVALVDDQTRRRLRTLPADGTRPIAVITTDSSIGHAVIDVDAHGLTVFDGHTVRCHRLTPAVADVTGRLLEHADTTPVADTTPGAAVVAEQPSLFPPSPDAWQVQLLGPLRIHHRQHGELAGGRTRQLLTLLALHRDGLTAEDIYDAVVPTRSPTPTTSAATSKHA